MPRGGHNKLHWTPELLGALVSLREAGNSTTRLAERLGIASPVVMNKLQELGLNGRRHRGSIPGHEVSTWKPKTKEEIKKARKDREARQRQDRR